MKMNIKPAFRCQLSSYLRGTLVIYSILIIIFAVSIFSSLYVGDNTLISLTGGGAFTTSIFMLVMGIVSIRSDLRLCLQYGVSRRTAFVGQIMTVLAVSAIISIGTELLMGIAQFIENGSQRFFVADLYQIIYVGLDKTVLSFGQHIMSILFSFFLVSSVCFVGMFFSLLFWRLSKFWTIVVAVAIPLLMNFVPLALYKAGVDLSPVIKWLGSSPVKFYFSFALASVILCVINWLLLRKANIREAKG